MEIYSDEILLMNIWRVLFTTKNLKILPEILLTNLLFFDARDKRHIQDRFWIHIIN